MIQNHRDNVIERLLGDYPSRKLPIQNIVSKLAQRECAIDSPAQLFYRQRSFYQCIVPDYTELGVQTPPGYLRKFTPDGNQLLAFSNTQKHVVLYDYLGSGAGQGCYLCDMSTEDLKAELFDKFFKLRFCIPVVASSNENLNRECSLFTNDGQYVIVGSSCLVSDDPYPHMFETFRNNESLSPNERFPLEDYTLYLVDIKAGVVSDSRQLKCDKIHLSHNQGLSLCDNMLAVLSLQHQTIHLFQVYSGLFIPMHEIGRFCHPDDALIFSEAHLLQPESTADGGEHNTSPEPFRPFLERWFNSLKHRLLCWLLKQAENACTPVNKTPLSVFFQKFDYLSSLRLWKMQLLDSEHLLLKYTTEDIVTLKQNDPTSQPAFFAIYDIKLTAILAVYENTSENFLRIYESQADSFRSPVSHPLAHYTSSVSNNLHARAFHMKFKQTITNAKYGGKAEATRRLLGQLPICSQSFSSSPYLDLGLFSYEDKWVSPLERPKQCGDTPVRWVVCRNECVV